MSLVEARDLDTSPPEWLADGMIPRTGVGILHGPSYAGKSLLADGELALAVANGTPFLGHPCVKGPVVLCLGEGLYDAGCRKQARLARQERDNTLAIAAAARDHGDEAARTLAAALPAYTDDLLYVHTEPFDIPLTRGRELSQRARQAVAAIRSRVSQPELIILDALADFTGGLSLSNDASANRLMLGLKMISAELDCCVCAIAHNDKKGDSLLGAQRLYNASDFVISVAPDDVTAPGAPKTATVSCGKSKYGPEFEPLGYRIEPCEWDEPELGESGEPTGQMVTVRSATIRLIEPDKPDSGKARPAPPPLPEIRETEKPRKRSGLRPRLHLIPGRAAEASPRAHPVPPADRQPLADLTANADARREIVRALIAPRCPDCSRPGGAGCDNRMNPQPVLLGRTLSGPLYAHENRILAAALAAPDPEGFLDRALGVLSSQITKTGN